MSTETSSPATPDYTDTRWPWRITVTRTDGTVREDDYAADFDPIGYARFASTKPDVARVEVATVFVAGEQVSPAATAKAPTLGQLITAALVAAGFTEYDHANSLQKPAFLVSEGVGATVSLAWVDAPASDRALMLTRYKSVLRASGLAVSDRGDHLYVAAIGEGAKR